MARMLRLISMVAACFCRHEWCSRHAGNRWYLECLHCGRTTSGVLVGPESHA